MARLSPNECVVNAHACQILRELVQPIEEEVAACVNTEDVLVQVRVSHVNTEAKEQERGPGSWFSPVERLIWLALVGGSMIGKRVASKCGQEYDSTFRVILRNLVNRGVLTHDETDGFSRAIAEPD